jgi:hypothetical protein
LAKSTINIPFLAISPINANQPDLRVQIQTRKTKRNKNHGACNRHRYRDQNDQGVPPAFKLRRKYQIDYQ